MENARDNKGKMFKIRGKDDAQCRSGSTASVGADSSLSLLKFVAGLMIFVVGVIVGLLSGSHVDRYFARFSFKNVYSDADLYVPYNSVKRNVVCATDDLLSMMAFTARQNLSHGLRDDELFWRATLVPEKEEFPFQRVPKVAFMFLTRGPLPLLPLWERFFSGQDVDRYSIFVHSPPEFELNVSIFSVFYQRRIPSKPVQWGSVSLVDGEKRLLANALLDFSNERFVLLSESCIPIYNFPTIYRYLVESDYSFVESYDDPSRYGRGRYSRRMRPDIELSDWRKGSQWFEMHRALAIKIVSDTKYYTLFSKYCKPSCYPDEHYIPTYTHKFFSNLNSNRTITYVDWSLIAPHPATFTEADITVEFIRKLRNNGIEDLDDIRNGLDLNSLVEVGGTSYECDYDDMRNPRKRCKFSYDLNFSYEGVDRDVSGNGYENFGSRPWERLQYLSLWISVGLLLTPLASAGLEDCPNLEEIRIKVEGDCRELSRPAKRDFGLSILLNYPQLTRMHLDCGDIIGYAHTAPSGQMDLSLWERFYLFGIGHLSLTELDYWPPQDRDVNQRGLSLPAAGLLQECFGLRKLFIHGTAHEHFMMFLLRIPDLRDVQLREDYYPAPENDMSTEMRADSCSRFEAALNRRQISD